MSGLFLTDGEVLTRFLLAIVWGGIVGVEREYRSKAAGFRTMIMISVGSCFFTMMSVWIGTGNPDRIASNIVTGIGFLGAGVIFRGDSRVVGITTAASIWTVAAVGMGISGGFYFASGAASILIFIVLALLPKVEVRIDDFSQFRTYKIQCTYRPDAKAHFDDLMSQSQLKFKLVNQVKEADTLLLTWQVQGTLKKHNALTDLLMSDPLAERIEC